MLNIYVASESFFLFEKTGKLKTGNGLGVLVAGDYHFTPTLISIMFFLREQHFAYKSNNLFLDA